MRLLIIINDQIPISNHLDSLVIGKLELIWNLEFGYWNFNMLLYQSLQ